MTRFALTLIALTLPYAAVAKDLRFVGTWDCGTTTVTLTDSTYDAGAGPKAITSIEGDGHDFTLGFADGSGISLSVNDAATEMRWRSPASGKSATCRRKG